MKCPSCHAENRDDSRFCGNYGALPASGGPEPAASFTRTLEMPVDA
ncbi:MAG: zinc-ribbon domain-containing protein [Candidatus Aminicenantes bacterium]|nr:zinc-ribbon domain-containing protein [Candidatus Aminicenantes bacterium]